MHDSTELVIDEELRKSLRVACAEARGVRLVRSHRIHTHIVRDSSGIVWRITESHAQHVPGSMALTCLIFDSQASCRRHWCYPANWLTLAKAALLDLMNQPRPAVR